jgi:hypothetical protein
MSTEGRPSSSREKVCHGDMCQSQLRVNANGILKGILTLKIVFDRLIYELYLAFKDV